LTTTVEDDPIGFLLETIEELKLGGEIKNGLIEQLEEQNRILGETVESLDISNKQLREIIAAYKELSGFIDERERIRPIHGIE